MRSCSPYMRLSVNFQYKKGEGAGLQPAPRTTIAWICGMKTYWGWRREQDGECEEESKSPIHRTPRWAVFLFFPFISVSTHSEQKAANADETNQADDVVCAPVFVEEEDKQWDLDNQVFQWLNSFIQKQ